MIKYTETFCVCKFFLGKVDEGKINVRKIEQILCQFLEWYKMRNWSLLSLKIRTDVQGVSLYTANNRHRKR